MSAVARSLLLRARGGTGIPAGSNLTMTTAKPYSSNWALALLGGALFGVLLVGMVRELTERWGGEARLDGT